MKNEVALLDLWWKLYRTIRFSVARGAETLVRLKYKLCLSPNTQENQRSTVFKWLWDIVKPRLP